MSSQPKRAVKRKFSESQSVAVKKRRAPSEDDEDDVEEIRIEETAGKILRIVLHNIMCHDNMVIDLNENTNLIVGKNGSGKSAIVAALTVGLGARASATDRVGSLQELIKRGCPSATVEITLSNVGSNAYLPDVYGKSITVVRTIGVASNYKIKNSSGRIMSGKKAELEKILAFMNIQVDNPISVLNQEQSRQFLKDSDEYKKYQLFMKATQLDLITTNYKAALALSDSSRQSLKIINDRVEKESKEIENLEKNLEILLSLDDTRQQIVYLEGELLWSQVSMEEDKLNMCQSRLNVQIEKLQDLETARNDHGAQIDEITAELEALNDQLNNGQEDSRNTEADYMQAKAAAAAKKEQLQAKHRDLKTHLNQMHSLKSDLKALEAEIARLEGGTDRNQQRRNEAKAKIATLQEKLENTEAILSTTRVDATHLDTDRSHLDKQVETFEQEYNRQRNIVRNLEQQIAEAKSQSSDAVAVFGNKMPRLLKRINEEFGRKRFSAKPVGPLGRFIKVKDQSWIPAIESFLGGAFFMSFCVDNARDSKMLTNLIREIYGNDRNVPNIICSKFRDDVHNIRGRCCNTRRHTNLFDAMEISHPVVANCLIDQREPECVLLIPTNAETREMMTHRENVPPYCHMAITQKGDTFYPAPKYRCYGGSVQPRARWLQVSTTEVIHGLEEDLTKAIADRNHIKRQYDEQIMRLKRSQTDCANIRGRIDTLIKMSNRLKNEIQEQIANIPEEVVNDNCDILKTDKKTCENKIKTAAEIEEQIKREKQNLEAELRELEKNSTKCRRAVEELKTKLTARRNEINDLKLKKQELESNENYSKQQIREQHEAIKKAQNELEEKRISTAAIVQQAMDTAGERIETTKSPLQLEKAIKKLQDKIAIVEGKLGSKEALEAEIEKKKSNMQVNVETLRLALELSNAHCQRMKERRRECIQMKEMMGNKVKKAFVDVLALRNYQGDLTIDYNNKSLELHVTPHNNSQAANNTGTATLSGGEKSYSTVAFILALWECTKLPFYFLDEFDVYMDLVNRRVALDILLQHARDHPEHQFCLLTPQDISAITSDERLTIHRMAAPERTNTVNN